MREYKIVRKNPRALLGATGPTPRRFGGRGRKRPQPPCHKRKKKAIGPRCGRAPPDEIGRSRISESAAASASSVPVGRPEAGRRRLSALCRRSLAPLRGLSGHGGGPGGWYGGAGARRGRRRAARGNPTAKIQRRRFNGGVPAEEIRPPPAARTWTRGGWRRFNPGPEGQRRESRCIRQSI